MCRTLRFFLLSILALLTFALTSPSARSQIRDGGIDPANLGQGGWLYLMNNATNHLSPNNIAAVTNENSLFQYMRSQGLRYVIVKAGTSDQVYYDNTYSTTQPVFTTNLVNLAHANGLKIFGSNRSWGSNIVGEIAIADYVFNQGADGFIYDAEAEWETGHAWITNGPAQAWWLCGTVRSNWPTKFIAHNPFDTLYLHSSFPYKEFGYWCDVVMPQVYHHSASQGNAIAAIHWTDVNYRTFQNSLASLPVGNSNGLTVYWTNAIKPLVLMRDVYGANFSPAYPPSDVRNFLDYLVADPNCVTVGGYQGSDYFRSELYDLNQWAYMKASTIGIFPDVVNNIILDDAGASLVGTWTLVKTIDATTGSTVSFTGEFGTDTNSFGTNYWKAAHGTGTGYMQFTPNILTAGDYLCYQWHPFRADASASVPHIINYDGGSTTVYANQRTNAGNWSLLGRFNFAAGTSGYIRVTDGIAEAGAVAMADGVKMVFLNLPIPAGLTATAVSPFQVNLAWPNNSTNATSYTMARSLQPGGPYVDLVTVAANTNNYTDGGLVENTRYYYVVRAVNALGSTSNSREAGAWTWAINPVPAKITSPPQTLVILAGQSAAFTVAATGTTPLCYQWRLGGADIAGATTTALTIPLASAANAGAYSVMVTNRYGADLSPDAQLVLTPVALSGDNSFGQSEVITAATNVIAVAAGAWHTLALKADGTVAAWGDDSVGQCEVPLALTDALAIAAGGYHGLAIRANSSVAAWGADDYGQTDVPAGLGNVLAIAAGTWHSVALRADGTLVVWGDNSFQQANQPAGLTNVTAVAAGGNHTLALKADGTLVAWGENTDAEGNVTAQSVVPWGLTNVVAIAAGEYHSLAVKRDGTVVAWGDNSQDQCNVPAGLSNVVAVAGGGGHSLALGADGTLTAWGADWNGQCNLPAGLAPAVGVAAGSDHTVALLEGMIPVPRLLNPARKGSRFSALVQTLNRKSYALECKNALAAANWTALYTNTGNGALRILTDPTASGTQRFYRMRQWSQ